MRVFILLLSFLFTVCISCGQRKDYMDISDKFSPELFNKIKAFVLENGSSQTYRNLDSDNPSYAFATLTIYLGVSQSYAAYILKDFKATDYYEMVFHDVEGNYYTFICFDHRPPKEIFIHKDMQVSRVYWKYWEEGGSVERSILTLLAQIEDEIVQNTAANNPKNFTAYTWQLKAESDWQSIDLYMPVPQGDLLSFEGNQVFVNEQSVGTYQLDEKNNIIALSLIGEKTPAFCLYRIDDVYYYRYHFNKVKEQLHLVPLDEKDENGNLMRVEGRALQWESPDKD